jgi:hypothetical protein
MSLRRAAILLACALTTGAWACSSEESGSPSCPPDNPECKELSTAEKGQEAVQKRKCASCHTQNLAGNKDPLPGNLKTSLGEPIELYAPNLTNDKETGLGSWTDDAIALAIRNGVDDESQTLCPQMQHLPNMTDFEVYSIVKHLRTIAPVRNAVPRSVCPPLKTKEQQSQPR